MNNHNLEERYKEYLDNKTETSGCTLEEYKSVYPRLMGNHKQQWNDFDEIDFIDREILNHNLNMECHVNGLERLRVSDFEYRDKKFNSEEDFLNMMSYFEKRIASHKKIISFLKTKKLEIEVPQQDEAFKPDEVLKNPDATIFKDDFAFSLFDKMKGYYSDTSTPQADYSFLFDIMQKEGFVICKGVKFIEYLSKFDIAMTKIDSSKTGNKRKTKLYNATKENLQKKHGLSTI